MLPIWFAFFRFDTSLSPQIAKALFSPSFMFFLPVFFFVSKTVHCFPFLKSWSFSLTHGLSLISFPVVFLETTKALWVECRTVLYISCHCVGLCSSLLVVVSFALPLPITLLCYSIRDHREYSFGLLCVMLTLRLTKSLLYFSCKKSIL